VPFTALNKLVQFSCYVVRKMTFRLALNLHASEDEVMRE